MAFESRESQLPRQFNPTAPLQLDSDMIRVVDAKVDQIGVANSATEVSQTLNTDSRLRKRQVILPPPPDYNYRPTISSRLISLQQWEGYVVSVDTEQNTMAVRLRDLEQAGNQSEETAELSLLDVSEDDLELVKPGGVFRWIIGYRDQLLSGGRRGTRERVSALYFRRLPAWSTKDLKDTTERANELSDAFQRRINSDTTE